MQALLTGATGYVGREVLGTLLAQGDSVRVVVRPETLSRSQDARQLLERDGVEIVPLALTDLRGLTEALEGVEVAYHLAWQSNRDGHGGRTPSNGDLAQTNIDLTKTFLSACAEQKIRRLVYTSTVAVYGSSSSMEKWPVGEETPLLQDSYGGDYSRNYIEPKVAIENMIRQEAAASGFECVILRPSIVYGVGAPFVERMVERAMQGPPQANPGRNQSGLQVVHVRDTAEAVGLAGRHPEAAGREFNIAGNEVATADEMTRMLRAAAFRIHRGLPLPGRFLGGLEGYRRYDTTKAETILGFQSRVSLPEGLGEIMAATMGGQAGPATSEASAGVRQVYDSRMDLNLLGDYYDGSDFWDFGYWDHDTKTQAEACVNLVEKLLGYIDTKGTLLDVACGKGATTRHLLNYYKPENITAINISEKQLEIARRNAPGVTFLTMDATKLEFPSESFDNVLCVEAAGHFDTKDEFLREAYRVLKPGGRLSLCDAIFRPQARARQVANHVSNAEEYRESLVKAGFEEAETVDVTEHTWVGFDQSLAAYLENGLNSGTLSQQQYNAIGSWLGRLENSFEFYVMGWCRKAPR